MLFECGVKRIKLKFYLMNYAWGKAIMDFFLGCMVISAYVVPAIDIICAIFFFSATILLVIVSIRFRKEEKMRIDDELEILRNYKDEIEKVNEKKR